VIFTRAMASVEKHFVTLDVLFIGQSLVLQKKTKNKACYD